jgi:DNA-3-methyladenine glycosylase II
VTTEAVAPPAALSVGTLARAVGELGARDQDLARLARRHGTPPLWDRPPGFATLVLIILEQQVSLASARAAFDRLHAAIGQPTPQALLRLGDGELRAIGFSRQKTAYVRELSSAIVDHGFEPAMLSGLPDETARAALVRHRGIGDWTADIYLLMALRRPDVWPAGDLALQVAAREIKRLAERPSRDEMETLAENWRPWRSVAARMLWQHYLAR